MSPNYYELYAVNCFTAGVIGCIFLIFAERFYLSKMDKYEQIVVFAGIFFIKLLTDYVIFLVNFMQYISYNLL